MIHNPPSFSLNILVKTNNNSKKRQLTMKNGTRKKKGRLISAFWIKCKPTVFSQLKSTQR